MPARSSRAGLRRISSPPDENVRLLVTRPEPEGERTAARLRAGGHEVVLAPMLRVEPVADAAFGAGPWAGVVFTSANAVRAIAAHRRFGELPGLPAFAVGTRTREAAMAAGFSDVVSADGGVDDLAGLIAARIGGGGPSLLYLAGNDRAGDLAGALAKVGLPVETVVAYRAVIVGDFDARLRAVLAGGGIDGVLHYSARTADAFIAAAQAAGLTDFAMKIRHFCLSPQVAARLAAAGAVEIGIAAAPNEAALLALIDGP
jgi:uroporphyrinogen-III synthase